jgi:hypothetical protein
MFFEDLTLVLHLKLTKLPPVQALVTHYCDKKIKVSLAFRRGKLPANFLNREYQKRQIKTILG